MSHEYIDFIIHVSLISIEIKFELILNGKYNNVNHLFLQFFHNDNILRNIHLILQHQRRSSNFFHKNKQSPHNILSLLIFQTNDRTSARSERYSISKSGEA